jgi:2-keto-4-pentenoate hydratase
MARVRVFIDTGYLEIYSFHTNHLVLHVNCLESVIDSERPAQAILDIARSFTAARRAAVPIAEYPGQIPPDMATGYAVQEAAIGMWPERIVGWKVGLVPGPLQASLGTAHLAGPIFSDTLVRSTGADTIPLAAISGGFAAIEVELIAAARVDAPPAKTDWTLLEAAEFTSDWYFGVEFAASPLATINDLGPTVVASDFGNNSGLILGLPFDHGLIAEPAKLTCRAQIDGTVVGLASVAALPGGPIAALRFLLGHLASRGRPLRAGQLVSTGAITGVHRIFPGQRGEIEFIGHGKIDVLVTAAVSKSISRDWA